MQGDQVLGPRMLLKVRGGLEGFSGPSIRDSAGYPLYRLP